MLLGPWLGGKITANEFAPREVKKKEIAQVSDTVLVGCVPYQVP